ncbi:fumarylacetoacetate hydrolase family protein [Rhodobacteraceae bacterium D3-12]|nr:fumarylacetoacetate hydrolase family protein [Rhodobacteraceae bacterium D3-12]
MDHQTLGRVLAEARREGRKLRDYPCDRPESLDDAFAVQDAMVAAMGVLVAGWKVGLTSKLAQEVVGVDAPFAGPVFADAVFESGAGLGLAEGDLGILEAEVGFRMKESLPPRDGAYTRAEVLGAVGAVMPVFEWVNKRLPGDIREAKEWLVADGTFNSAVICGAEVAFDPGMDLRGETVAVFQDGEEKASGVGANALGDPAEVLVWLANDLRRRGKGLRAGDVVATGLLSGLVYAEAGADYAARFATLGQVNLRVT